MSASLLATPLGTLLGTPPGTVLANVPAAEFVWLLPLCGAIALVSASSHRDDIKEIIRHAARGAVILIVGLLAFMVTISYVFEWLLP